MLENILKEAVEHILPFWMEMKDEVYGGYYGGMDCHLNLDKQGDKGGIASARILWSFAAAYNTFGEPVYLNHARHAYDFLITKVLDPSDKGLYWMLDYQGNLIDDRKHVYAQSFGIYALSEYYAASNDETALDQALELFYLIEGKGYDFRIDIYGEEYSKDWKPRNNEMLSENGITATITTNTLLHILEAYTRLHQVSKNVAVKKQLLFLVKIFKDKIWNKESNHMRVFFDEHWNEIIDLTSYGHDIEATWLYDLALKELGLDDNEDYTCFITDIGEQVSRVAMDGDGSIYNESEDGRVDKDRIWWCQAEALVGYVNLMERTGDHRYKDMAERLWLYISDNIVDKRTGGEWYYSVHDDGNASEGQIIEPWKTPYHNLRACIEICKRAVRV